jgi:hypothetical protein
MERDVLNMSGKRAWKDSISDQVDGYQIMDDELT